MNDINAIAAWACIAAGVFSGAASGLFFHDERWLGGYGSWPRRMLRLGHISFFGIGLLNLAYALTLHVIGWPAPPAGLSWALAAAGALMPGVCYLAAWRMPLRRLFALPVGCVLLAVGGLLWWRIQS
jgi:hypothetical protein